MPPCLRQREWHLWFAASAGVSVALVTGLVMAHDVPLLLAGPALLAIPAAMTFGSLAAFRYQPFGEVYYPRSDGGWHDLTGTRIVDLRHLVSYSVNTRAATLPAAFEGGFVAATVSERQPAGRMVPAGYEPQTLTLLVSAPGSPSYRTRLNVQLLPEDFARTEPGQVLLALRFSSREPDIALVSAGFAASFSGEDREHAQAALAAALDASKTPDVQIWDARTRRVLHKGYPQFLSFYAGNPGALWRDFVTRGEWRIWLHSLAAFCVSFAGGAILVGVGL